MPSALAVASRASHLAEHDAPFLELLRRAVAADATPDRLAAEGLTAAGPAR